MQALDAERERESSQVDSRRALGGGKLARKSSASKLNLQLLSFSPVCMRVLEKGGGGVGGGIKLELVQLQPPPGDFKVTKDSFFNNPNPSN